MKDTKKTTLRAFVVRLINLFIHLFVTNYKGISPLQCNTSTKYFNIQYVTSVASKLSKNELITLVYVPFLSKLYWSQICNNLQI